MNILFLDQYSDLGGGQRCLLDLLPAVRERGWNIWAAAPGAGPLIPALRHEGAKFEAIPCGPYSMGHKSVADLLRFAAQTPRLAAAISDISKRAHADLLYVNGPRLLPAAAWAAAHGAGRSPLPILFHCQSHLPQRYAVWLAGQSLRRARSTIVACCRFAGEPLTPFVGPERYHVVSNAVAGPACGFAPGNNEVRSRSSDWRIGVVGRISPEKGQAEFLRAARLLAPTLPGARFVICGDALFSDPAAKRYRDRLRGLAAGLPVEFLGWRDDIYAVLAKLDLLVVPSVREPGMPRVLLEGYAAGVPVIAFPSGGIPEAVSDGETGFLVDHPTPEALAEKIRSLLHGDPAGLKEVAQKGHALWRERFTLEGYRREMLEMIAIAARSSP